jgi:hypothetical protein
LNDFSPHAITRAAKVKMPQVLLAYGATSLRPWVRRRRPARRTGRAPMLEISETDAVELAQEFEHD